MAADRLAELMAAKRDAAFGAKPPTKLAEFVTSHLVAKAQSGKFSETWLATTEHMLKVAVEHFGKDRDLASIEVEDVERYIEALRVRPTNRRLPDGSRGTLGDGGVTHHLNALSNLYRRAASKGAVKFNPVAALIDKPAGQPREAKWLLVHEAALLLKSARTNQPARPTLTMPFAYELIATMLLTGGRESEILGLDITDVDLDGGTVMIRPNRLRRLKTKTSRRLVALAATRRNPSSIHRTHEPKERASLPATRGPG